MPAAEACVAEADAEYKDRLRAFYTPESLASAAARGSWCEPDLAPLP